MEHLDNLRAKLDAIAEQYPEYEGDPYLKPLRDLTSDLPTERKGTMRAWFEGRTMTEVDTLQITRSGAPWHAGPRMVEARATMVRLDGSVSDYKGSRVIGADDDTLVVHNTSGFDTVTIYRAVPAA